MNSQPVTRTSSKRSSPDPLQTNTRSSRGSTAATPHQQARRKRAVSRQKRNFEAAFSRLPIPKDIGASLQWVEVPVALHPTPWHFSKMLSLLLLLGALYSITMLHNQDEWFVYREDVRFNSLIRLRADELYQVVNVEGWNIFWIEPETIRKQLLALPWVEDAQVNVTIPTALSINIIEMNPVAVWVTNEGNFWLAANGAALPIVSLEKSALPELALPQIIDTLQEARVVGEGALAIDPQVLQSALKVMEAMPELESKIRYNKSIGLNFPLLDPNVWVYWGNGFDLETKLQNLVVTSELVRDAEEPAQILDIRLVDRPYVRYIDQFGE